jgi:hypothetical protein
MMIWRYWKSFCGWKKKRESLLRHLPRREVAPRQDPRQVVYRHQPFLLAKDFRIHMHRSQTDASRMSKDA